MASDRTKGCINWLPGPLLAHSRRFTTLTTSTATHQTTHFPTFGIYRKQLTGAEGMAGKSPGFWFFTGDWLKDPELRFCSIFARGLLVDLLCILFEANERGYASKPDGTPRSDAEIVSAVSGGSVDEKLSALAELECSGVLSRDNRGVLYSRRLARLGEITETRSKAGSKGGSKTQAKAKQTTKQNTGVTDSDSDSDSVSKKVSKDTYSEDFESFWESYPPKRRTSKKTAYAKWQSAIKVADPKTIIEAAKRYAASPAGMGEYVKGPEPWLNGQCWQDAPEAWGISPRISSNGLPAGFEDRKRITPIRKLT
jgi:hypothetical protein